VSKHHHDQHGPEPPPPEQATAPAADAQDGKPQPAATPSGPAAKDPSQDLRAELDAAKNRELRCQAELENFRKRAARELDERLRYANIGLLRDLMPVIDNVERAIQAADNGADAAALLEGFKMVNQQLDDVLRPTIALASKPCTQPSIRIFTMPSCSKSPRSTRPTRC